MKKFKKLRFMLLISTFLVSIFLSACTSSNSGEVKSDENKTEDVTDSGEQVTIKFMTPWGAEEVKADSRMHWRQNTRILKLNILVHLHLLRKFRKPTLLIIHQILCS